MKAAPDSLEVETTCRVPQPAMHSMVAGAGFGADWENLPVLTAHWVYAGAKQETREMLRVGLAA
jgi:hypothetical protein